MVAGECGCEVCIEPCSITNYPAAPKQSTSTGLLVRIIGQFTGACYTHASLPLGGWVTGQQSALRTIAPAAAAAAAALLL